MFFSCCLFRKLGVSLAVRRAHPTFPKIFCQIFRWPVLDAQSCPGVVRSCVNQPEIAAEIFFDRFHRVAQKTASLQEAYLYNHLVWSAQSATLFRILIRGPSSTHLLWIRSCCTTALLFTQPCPALKVHPCWIEPCCATNYERAQASLSPLWC